MAPYILYGAILVVLALDGWLYARGGQPATISGFVRMTPRRAAILAALMGLLFGHLFL